MTRRIDSGCRVDAPPIWRIVVGIACLILAACSAPESKPERPRNLVLISIDTLVADRMSAYGHARATTPAIDVLQQDTLRFTNAFTTSPWTLPAHTSMLSGRYPSTISDDPNSKAIYHIPTVLPELFKKKGYRTAAFTAAGYVGANFGFKRGFDRYDDDPADSSGRASAWLEEKADAPFFLFFHTYSPHAVYKDRRFLKPGEGGRIRSIFAFDSVDVATDVMQGAMKLTPDEQEYLLDFYDGGVAAADDMAGELIETLERLGQLENTTIVVVSDHGEEFWQHTGRAMYHGHTLYDELLRIPLLWFERGLPKGGTASDVPVTLADLVPTFISRFGLAWPDDLYEIDGIDLSPILDGEVAGDLKRPLFAEAVLHGPDRFSVRTERGKLIWTPKPNQQKAMGVQYPVPVKGVIELYLPDDRGEMNDVSTERPALRGELMEILDTHLRKARETSKAIPLQELSEDTLDQLRNLGYVE